jgi:hypothetical protein
MPKMVTKLTLFKLKVGKLGTSNENFLKNSILFLFINKRKRGKSKSSYEKFPLYHYFK